MSGPGRGFPGPGGRSPLGGILGSIISLVILGGLIYLAFFAFIWVILPLIGLVIGYLLGLRHGLRLGRRHSGGQGPNPASPKGWHRPGE